MLTTIKIKNDDCECRVEIAWKSIDPIPARCAIIHCPLHAAAPQLRDALLNLVRGSRLRGTAIYGNGVYPDAESALRLAGVPEEELK